jgi:anti-sigma regulatory factor (Ser/Thr protein kinase)
MPTPERREWRLIPNENAPTKARGMISAAVAGRVGSGDLDNLLLLTTELVANAVKHGVPEFDGHIGLRLEIEPSTVRVVVTDGGSHFRRPTRDEEPGPPDAPRFGLFLVDAVAVRWGVSVDGKKAVWAEVDLGSARS